MRNNPCRVHSLRNFDRTEEASDPGMIRPQNDYVQYKKWTIVVYILVGICERMYTCISANRFRATASHFRQITAEKRISSEWRN